MKIGKLIIAIILIVGILVYSVADINHGHGLEEHGYIINQESRA